MCILASPALGPGVAVERRRVAAPVAAATARAPGRHGVRAAPGGAAHGAARPGDFVGGAWGGAGARGPASDGGGGGVRGQRARAAQGPPHVPPLLLLGVPRPRAPGSAPVPGRRRRQDPTCLLRFSREYLARKLQQRPRPGSPGAAVATRPPCCSSPPPLAPAPAFGVLLHWMALPDAPAPVPGALALPPFLDGNLRCAPRAYPCSGAFASCAVCGGLPRGPAQ